MNRKVSKAYRKNCWKPIYSFPTPIGNWKNCSRNGKPCWPNISHDLRAPITAIRSAIDYLTSGQNIRLEDYESSIRLIDHRTATLENLIQDMYYLFCVEDTSKELDLQPIDALPFLEEYFYDATAASLYDDHEMILDLPEDLQCQIDIDVQKMVRVLDNLFTNAAKYTPKGSSITLHAKITSDHQFLQIAVSDNGPGIPPEALPHLFWPYLYGFRFTHSKFCHRQRSGTCNRESHCRTT